MNDFSHIVDNIRLETENKDYRFTVHALERCIERDISPDDVRKILLAGDIIEYYPEDKYGPSCLMRGITTSMKILHVNCSIDPIWIITAYDPSLKPEQWDDEYRRRKK